MKSVDPGMRDLFTLQHAGWFTRLRKLAFPNALPALFTGISHLRGLVGDRGRSSASSSFQQGKPGLGLRLVQYRVNIEYEKLYTCLIWSSLLGIAVFLFFGWLSNRLFAVVARVGTRRSLILGHHSPSNGHQRSSTRSFSCVHQGGHRSVLGVVAVALCLVAAAWRE